MTDGFVRVSERENTDNTAMTTREIMRDRARKGIEEVAVILGMFAIAGVYALFLFGPAVAAWYTADALFSRLLYQVVAILGFTVVYGAISVGIGSTVGVFDMENATGRMPGRR